MTLALLTLAALFLLLLVGRLAGGRRAALLRRWPSIVLAAAALFAATRGQLWFALGLVGASAVAWALAPPPRLRRSARSQPPPNHEDAAARAILGVGPNATADEIRTVYRAKMAKAHPDRGGTHAEAARLTAARDRLLKR